MRFSNYSWPQFVSCCLALLLHHFGLIFKWQSFLQSFGNVEWIKVSFLSHYRLKTEEGTFVFIYQCLMVFGLLSFKLSLYIPCTENLSVSFVWCQAHTSSVQRFSFLSRSLSAPQASAKRWPDYKRWAQWLGTRCGEIQYLTGRARKKNGWKEIYILYTSRHCTHPKATNLLFIMHIWVPKVS